MNIFSKQCLRIVSLIPFGRVTTYQSIALALGSKAFRAVGNAVASNPYLITIPCHRVVNSSGKVGGYVLGKQRKISLLVAEGILIQDGYIMDFADKFIDAQQLLCQNK